MAKGGFKVLINGQIKRCHSFKVDYDELKFWNLDMGRPYAEKFDRKKFAVMTVTTKDME